MTEWYLEKANKPSENYRKIAKTHTDNLTKPNGSLGMLESIAITLASLQSTKQPMINNPVVRIFAADHGVAQEAVSAFPQAVTVEMVRNFSAGGAAICVLSNSLNASFLVINTGTVLPVEPLQNVKDKRIDAGTQNFVHSPAMSMEQVLKALTIGKDTIEDLDKVDCFIGGEMGIANTTSATAVACALLECEPELLVGYGTGVSEEGIHNKTKVIHKALMRHKEQLINPLMILQHLGGFEIAALVGAYIRAAQKSIPILVDGFICSVAVLAAVKLNPSIRPWLLFSHQSAEAGHQHVLASLQATPLLTLDMRLGEGSGAATAVPLIKTACELHNSMASFDSAGVSKE